MQFLMVKAELITDKNITANEFRIYVYLLSLYNKEKKCAFPSIENISESVGISESTVKRSIKKLEDLGYITVSKRKGAAGNYNIYQKLKHLITDKVTKVKSRDKATEENKSKHVVIDIDAPSEELPAKKEAREKKIDNHINVRLARAVTNVDKSPFAKTVLSLADEMVVRNAIKNFKARNGKSATFLVTLLTDEYFNGKSIMPARLSKILKSGLKGFTWNQNDRGTNEDDNMDYLYDINPLYEINHIIMEM